MKAFFIASAALLLCACSRYPGNDFVPAAPEVMSERLLEGVRRIAFVLQSWTRRHWRPLVLGPVLTVFSMATEQS